jgi:hypothetical protein
MKATTFVTNALMGLGFGLFILIQVAGRNGLLSDAEGALTTTAIFAAMGLSMGVTAGIIRVTELVAGLGKKIV